MTIQSVPSFKLLDDTTIPWIAWGNGTGQAKVDAIECGSLALESGIRHLDTAQLYENETETGEAIKKSSLSRDDVYVTSKRACGRILDSAVFDFFLLPVGRINGDKDPVPLAEVAKSVQGSLDRLGFVPDLYLIHNPYVAAPGELKALWGILEDLKSQGKLKSIGVSNFRPQDLETILEGAKFKPVVNQVSRFGTDIEFLLTLAQLEYHPYTLTHLKPVLELQAKHGIVTETFGALTPVIRHPTGGPLKPVLERIAERISKVVGKKLDANIVLLLWTRAQGVVAVTASGNPDRIKGLGEIATLPDLLEKEEVDEITHFGETIHFRFYVSSPVCFTRNLSLTFFID